MFFIVSSMQHGTPSKRSVPPREHETSLLALVAVSLPPQKESPLKDHRQLESGSEPRIL